MCQVVSRNLNRYSSVSTNGKLGLLTPDRLDSLIYILLHQHRGFNVHWANYDRVK